MLHDEAYGYITSIFNQLSYMPTIIKRWSIQFVFTLFFTLIAVCSFDLNAQSGNDTLGKLLQKKTRFEDVFQTVTEFYSTRYSGRGSGYNQWLRYLWWKRDRTDASGNIQDEVPLTKKAWNETEILINKAGPELQAMNPWTNLGPTSLSKLPKSYLTGIGRIDRIAFHPTNENTIYAGSIAGGLWVTYNNGTSWTNLTPELYTPGIAGIVVDKSNPSNLYVLTGDGETPYGYFNGMAPGTSTGVYKSANGGSTWKATGRIFPDSSSRGFRLIQHPVRSEVLYAATSIGLFVTINGGTVWNRVSMGGILNNPVNDMVFHPDKPEYMYVEQGVPDNAEFSAWYIANDSVFIELNVSDGPTGVGMALATSPNSNNTVMVMSGNSAGGFKGLYKGTFTPNANPILATVNFSTVRTTPNILGGETDGSGTGGQSSYDIAMTMKPSDGQTLVTAGLIAWKSSNQGSSIAAISKYSESDAALLPYLHPDMHMVAYNPLNNRLYNCNDGGIYFSNDDGTTWTNITAGMSISQYYSISGVEGNSNLLLGGTQDNGTMYRTANNTNFSHVRGADGFSTQINPLNNDKIYWTENESIYKSTNGGSSVSKIFNFVITSFNAGAFPEIFLFPGRPDTLFAFNSQRGIRSLNGGTTWDTIGTGIKGLDFAGDGSPGGYLILGTDIYRISTYFTLPVGNTNVTNGLPPGNKSQVMSFPGYPDWVWVSYTGYTAGRKVYFSENGGDTWANRSGSLPNAPINCMAVDNSATLYAGTDVGVFIRRIGDSDWTPYSNSLPRVPVTSIIINNTAGLIRISTLGRGLFSTNLVTAAAICPPNENVTTTLIGQHFFQTNGNLNTTSSISESAGTQVNMRAGQNVIMQPGFIARAGSIYTAKIGNCGTGIPTGSEQKEENIQTILPLQKKEEEK